MLMGWPLREIGMRDSIGAARGLASARQAASGHAEAIVFGARVSTAIGIHVRVVRGGAIEAFKHESPHAIDDGKWQRVMLGWPPYVIGGGTPNIQKNVIAERLLGLPHDAP